MKFNNTDVVFGLFPYYSDIARKTGCRTYYFFSELHISFRETFLIAMNKGTQLHFILNSIDFSRIDCEILDPIGDNVTNWELITILKTPCFRAKTQFYYYRNDLLDNVTEEAFYVLDDLFNINKVIYTEVI